MSKGTILVTDTLFIFDEHVKKLEAAGYSVERIEKPDSTEEEICQAVKGKVGYILGGIEKVTDDVIKAGADLRAIIFTGTTWQHYITGWQLATKNGIALANVPHANAESVAEWNFASAIAMVRDLFALGRTGKDTFKTVPALSDLKIGIVGLGHVGSHLARLFDSVGSQVQYWSPHSENHKFNKEALNKILSTSDIVCICSSEEAGKGWADKDLLSKIKTGAIVTILNNEVLDEGALLKELQSGRIRAFLDSTPKLPGFKELSLETFYCTNEYAAYNTFKANKIASDMATDTMINLLETGNDQHKVN